MSMLSEMGINIIEDDEAEEEEAKGGDLATTTARDVALDLRNRKAGSHRRPGAHVPARNGQRSNC